MKNRAEPSAITAFRQALAQCRDEILKTRLLMTIRNLERLYELPIEPKKAEARDLDLRRRRFVETRHPIRRDEEFNGGIFPTTRK